MCDQGQFISTLCLDFFTAKLRIVIAMRITGGNSCKDLKWYLAYGERTVLDIIRNVFLLASWQYWIRDHSGEIQSWVFESIEYLMGNAKNQGLILGAQTNSPQGRRVLSSSAPLPLDSLLYSKW